MNSGDSNDNKYIAKKIMPHNELADPVPKMTFEELVKGLSDIQDELWARGLEEPASLVHRALGRLTYITLNEVLMKRMEQKKKSEAA